MLGLEYLFVLCYDGFALKSSNEKNDEYKEIVMDKYATLNEPQREAVKHVKGPLLLLAGAGSGKTRVLTHRIAYLIEEKNVFPWKIMAITFTNKAAKEMKERVTSLIKEGGSEVWVSTFHSSCVKILRRDIDKIGYERSFSIYDTDDAKKVLRDIMKAFNIDPRYFKDSQILSEISSCKNKMIGPGEMTRTSSGDMRLRTIARVYTEYQKRLQENNALDFDDLLTKTVELFTRVPSVLEHYQKAWEYIMVDEYQDTNGVQFELVRLLAAKHRNLCVVGDDDQSIYRFRGADIQNILDFESIYSEAKVIRLEQNYRSTSNILGAANEVIRNNKKRKHKKLWTDNVEGNLVKHVQVMSEKEESSFITSVIEQQREENGRRYKDFAVLYRTNAQSRAIEEGFIKGSIPYRLVGGVSFYARMEIKDILSYMRILNNETDAVAAQRIINVPKRGIGETTIEKIAEYAMLQGISFMEGVRQINEVPGISRGKSNIHDFIKLVDHLKELAEVGDLQELILAVLDKTGYIKALELENSTEANDRIDNIKELVSKVIDYQENTEEPSLAGFLEDVALVSSIDTLEDDDNKVILMTLHSAKGLEFPVVFMAGFEEGLFPSYMSINSGMEEDIEEERRLCYVGITRAREELFITSASQRMLYGKTQYAPPSRFLQEIPKEYVESNAFSRRSLQDVSLRMEDLEPTPSYGQRVQSKSMLQTDLPKPTKVVLDYSVGDLVKHGKYGIGQVKKIVPGGADYQVSVNFPSVGEKLLMAGLAGLKKV